MGTQPGFKTKSKKIHCTVRQAHSAVNKKPRIPWAFPSQQTEQSGNASSLSYQHVGMSPGVQLWALRDRILQVTEQI